MGNTDAFESASAALGEPFYRMLSAVGHTQRYRATEITLRKDRCFCVNSECETVFFGKTGNLCADTAFQLYKPTAAEMEECLLRLCDYSVQTHRDQLLQGYITVKGGHRAGICGNAVKDAAGKIINFNEISTIRLRIARNLVGVADQLKSHFLASNSDTLRSLLIAGAPGTGKTTLLRDMANALSSARYGRFFAVTAADERGELSPEGVCCDVIRGMPKAEAILLAVRNLRPEAVLCDEIGTAAEVIALTEAVNSGVAVYASIHAGSAEELLSKPQIRILSENRVFSKAVLLYGYGQSGYRFECVNTEAVS
ncbi:MAG TPA: ATPase, T2SS/T4P/T4SS family [Oscillospiraceae bacterium]|nr:ATPase, T2SS/T4P/T4SS family [Oscillospiraceae bacterium]HPS35216.1 ATPase, T2SS/T4P/T4SS family [Oscillospiraceae bacterium]